MRRQDFSFQPLAIPDVILIQPKLIEDERGFFAESYNGEVFMRHGIATPFVQDNHSRSSRGVLRGLHFQHAPHGQAKLVRVVEGEVFDVAVDIRPNSPTYGQWVGERLSADNFNMLYIPEGFAHGFQVLSETCQFLYKTSRFYAPEYDAGILWSDPAIGIDWPLANPLVSEKDARLPFLEHATV